MASLDEIVADYEAKVAVLEADAEDFYKKANKAILYFSATAFVVGVFIGWVL